jgi:hypothetical protein
MSAVFPEGALTLPGGESMMSAKRFAPSHGVAIWRVYANCSTFAAIAAKVLKPVL